MYFDPLSAWLVSLVSNGIVVSGEKSLGGNTADYHQKRINQSNDMLNGDIRRIKNKYGLSSPEIAYEQIQLHISVTKKSFSFQSANGQIVIDIDNQEYIIEILEECAKFYSQYESLEEYRTKAEWFKKAATEARRRKEQYAKVLEENRIREAKEKEKEQTMTNIYVVVGFLIIFVFLMFFFS